MVAVGMLLMLAGRPLIVLSMGIVSYGAAGQAGHSQSFLVQVLCTFPLGHEMHPFHVYDAKQAGGVLIHFLCGDVGSALDRYTKWTEDRRKGDGNMAGCIIIVEGKTDKERLLQVLAEPVTILCTYGTYSTERAEQLMLETEDADELYLFTDEDDSGKKLRAQLTDDLPQAVHLHTEKVYREVADTPLHVLAEILEKAGFAVKKTGPDLGRPQGDKKELSGL